MGSYLKGVAMDEKVLQEEIERLREKNDGYIHQRYHEVFNDKEVKSLSDCMNDNCEYLSRKILRLRCCASENTDNLSA